MFYIFVKKEENMKIGNALQEQRKVYNISLSDLSKETGISTQNLSRWERNIVTPNILFCVQLAKYYGITLEELLDIELP